MAIVEDKYSDANNLIMERAIIISLLTYFVPAVLSPRVTDESGWDRGEGWVVYLSLPTGQVSWHIRDDHKSWFDHLKVVNINPWDGHDTEEKWNRICSIIKSMSKSKHRFNSKHLPVDKLQ